MNSKMYEEISIERLKIELSMFKSINMFNTIDEANIYIMEEPSEIQKIFPGIMELITLLENLYLYNKLCNVLYLFSNIIDYLSIVIQIKHYKLHINIDLRGILY